MESFKDKTHPETKQILARIIEITQTLESGKQSAEDMATVNGWSYDRLLYWLNQYGVINPKTLKIYGESDLQFKRRQEREEGLVKKNADQVIQDIIAKLKADIIERNELIQKQRREVIRLTGENERLAAKVKSFENGSL